MLVAECLQPLDKQLGEMLEEHNIFFDESQLPQGYIVSFGHLIPDCPPSTYRPHDKGHLLNQLLLKLEMANGINLKGYAPKFIGYIDPALGDDIVANGEIFSENFQITRMLFHGPAHRIMRAALDEAGKKGIINFKLESGDVLTPQQLLELLVRVTVPINVNGTIINYSLWNLLLDRTSEAEYHFKGEPFNVSRYNFNCRNPMFFTSLLRDFGNHVGLPNLRFYLTDSFYKMSLQYMARARRAYIEAGLPDGESIPESRFYYQCMNYFNTVTQKVGDVQQQCFFTLTPEEAVNNPNYEKIYEGHNVVKRSNKTAAKFGVHENWATYLL